MPRLLAPVFLLAFLVGPAAALAEDQGPAKGVPELQVLANYVGTWDIKLTAQNGTVYTGLTSAKWILDGYFLEQDTVLKDNAGKSDAKIKTLMTYDVMKKSYRAWMFVSFGEGYKGALDGEPQWDGKARTMTTVYRVPLATITLTSNFAEAGIDQWKLVITDMGNQVYGQATATNTRRK